MYRIITPPTANPISRSEAKAHLKLEDAFIEEDGLIDGMITAASNNVEKYIRQSLLEQTVEEYLDEWEDIMCLSLSPVTSVTKIEYRDTVDSLETLATSIYYTDEISKPARVLLMPDQEWPDLTEIRPTHKIIITYVSGFAVADLPEAIRQAIFLEIGYLYENRENIIMTSQSPNFRIRTTSQLLLSPYRMYGF